MKVFLVLSFVFIFACSASKKIVKQPETKVCNCSGIELCFYPASYSVCEKNYVNNSGFNELKKLLKLFEQTMSGVEKKDSIVSLNLKNIMILLESEKQAFILEAKMLCKMTVETPCDLKVRKKKLELSNNFNFLKNNLKKYLGELKEQIVRYNLKIKELKKKSKELDKEYKSKIVEAFEVSKELKNEINRLSSQCKTKIENLNFDLNKVTEKNKKMKKKLIQASSCVEMEGLLKTSDDEMFMKSFNLVNMIRVKVYNGTRRNGLATKVTKKLTSKSFTLLKPDNVPKKLRNKYPQTLIYRLTDSPNLKVERFFEIYFKGIVIGKNDMPPWLKNKASHISLDYVIILGLDTPKKFKY